MNDGPSTDRKTPKTTMVKKKHTSVSLIEVQQQQFADALASLFNTTDIQLQDVYFRRFEAYISTCDLDFLLESSQNNQYPLTRVTQEAFSQWKDNLPHFHQIRRKTLQCMLAKIRQSLSLEKIVDTILTHRTTDGMTVFFFACDQDDFRDAFISQIGARPSIEVLTILRWQFESGYNNGKSVLWLLSNLAAVGNSKAWMFVLEKMQGQLTLSDFRVAPLVGGDQQKSAIWMSACAGSIGLPIAWNILWDTFRDQLTPSDFRGSAAQGPNKGVSVIHLLMYGAYAGMIEQNVIEDILGNVPEICTISEIQFKYDPGAYSIAEMLQQDGEWGKKIRDLIDARNNLFMVLGRFTANSNQQDLDLINKYSQAALKAGYQHTQQDSDKRFKELGLTPATLKIIESRNASPILFHPAAPGNLSTPSGPYHCKQVASDSRGTVAALLVPPNRNPQIQEDLGDIPPLRTRSNSYARNNSNK